MIRIIIYLYTIRFISEDTENESGLYLLFLSFNQYSFGVDAIHKLREKNAFYSIFCIDAPSFNLHKPHMSGHQFWNSWRLLKRTRYIGKEETRYAMLDRGGTWPRAARATAWAVAHSVQLFLLLISQKFWPSSASAAQPVSSANLARARITSPPKLMYPMLKKRPNLMYPVA
jgi:hypothetical protein